jgi:hypothetical protein
MTGNCMKHEVTKEALGAHVLTYVFDGDIGIDALLLQKINHIRPQTLKRTFDVFPNMSRPPNKLRRRRPTAPEALPR